MSPSNLLMATWTRYGSADLAAIEAELQPGAEFVLLCEQLLIALNKVAERELPPGWRIAPYGSYVQDTCLRDAVLDIALISPNINDHSLEVASELREKFVQVLLCTPAFKQKSNLEEAVASVTTAEEPVSLLAGGLMHGQWVARQELAIHIGKHSTGRLDSKIRSLLCSDQKAKMFVLMVKRWAKSRGLTGPSLGGSFPWTLLAIFSMQNQGILPSFKAFAESNRQPLIGTKCTDWGFRFMLKGFVELLLHQSNQSSFRLPGARHSMRLWTGTFEATGCQLPLLGNKAASDMPAPGASQDDCSKVLCELRRLQAALRRGDGMQVFCACISSPCTPVTNTTSATASMDSSSSSSSSCGNTPEKTDLPYRRFVTGKQTCPSMAKAATLSLLKVPPFPEEQLPPTQPQPSAQTAVPPIDVLRNFKPPPGLEHPTHVVEHPSCISRRSKGVVHQSSCWHVDAKWVASCTRGGQMITAVQLDPWQNQGLSRRDWERRFSRREHQIGIAKGTEEYRKWQQYFARHGRHVDQPLTPRVVSQNSKREFETEYSKWRIQLHLDPPEASGHKHS